MLEVSTLRVNTRKSPRSLRQELPRARQPVWDTAHPWATHRGDSLGGLGLINANSSALGHFSSLAGVLGFAHAVGRCHNECTVFLVGLMNVPHRDLEFLPALQAEQQ